MDIFVIGTVFDRKKNQMIGLRLIEISKRQLMDVDLKSFVNNMQRGIEICNASYNNGKIKIDNMNVSTMPRIDGNTHKVYANDGVIILYKLGDLGFMICTPSGNVMNRNTRVCIEKARETRILNGKVVADEYGNAEIQPVDTPFIDKEANAKMGMDKGIPARKRDISNVGALTTDNKQMNAEFKNNAKIMVQQADSFGTFSELQENIIAEYYMWYTKIIYKSIAGTTRLKTNIRKANAIAQMKGETTWRFAGIRDFKYDGIETCELGHPLRYVYYAAPKGSTDMNEWLKFGATCAGDFFTISEDGIKKLIKTRTQMSNEIDFITEISTNNRTKSHNESFAILKSMLSMVYDKSNEKLESAREDLMNHNAFKAMCKFVINDIPLPFSIIESVSSLLRKYKVEIVSTMVGSGYSINEFTDSTTLKTEIEKALEYIFDYGVEGMYQYNPNDETYKRRDKGGYNKDTRNERKLLESYASHVGIKHSSDAFTSQYVIDNMTRVLEYMRLIRQERDIVDSCIMSVLNRYNVDIKMMFEEHVIDENDINDVHKVSTVALVDSASRQGKTAEDKVEKWNYEDDDKRCSKSELFDNVQTQLVKIAILLDMAYMKCGDTHFVRGIRGIRYNERYYSGIASVRTLRPVGSTDRYNISSGYSNGINIEKCHNAVSKMASNNENEKFVAWLLKDTIEKFGIEAKKHTEQNEEYNENSEETVEDKFEHSTTVEEHTEGVYEQQENVKDSKDKIMTADERKELIKETEKDLNKFSGDAEMIVLASEALQAMGTGNGITDDDKKAFELVSSYIERMYTNGLSVDKLTFRQQWRFRNTIACYLVHKGETLKEAVERLDEAKVNGVRKRISNGKNIDNNEELDNTSKEDSSHDESDEGSNKKDDLLPVDFARALRECDDDEKLDELFIHHKDGMSIARKILNTGYEPSEEEIGTLKRAYEVIK